MSIKPAAAQIEHLKQKIEQTKRDIQTIRESLAISREELQRNPDQARKIAVENADLIKAGWQLKDELDLLEAELKRHEA